MFSKVFKIGGVAVAMAMLLLAGCAPGESPVQVRNGDGDICIAEVKPGVNMTVGYMVLDNFEDSVDWDLVGVESEQAGSVEIHTVIKGEKKGTMRMEKVDRLTIPARGLLQFKPRGNHLMLVDTAIAMRDVVTLTLHVESADGRKDTVMVQTAARKICSL